MMPSNPEVYLTRLYSSRAGWKGIRRLGSFNSMVSTITLLIAQIPIR